MLECIRSGGHFLLLSLRKVLAYPTKPTERIYFLYLFSSALLAVLVYYRTPSAKRAHKNVVSFLFPRSVWSHPSTWLDLRYFFLHQMVRVWIYASFIEMASRATFQRTLAVMNSLFGPAAIGWSLPGTMMALLYTITSIVAIDFANFFVHYLQHKNRFLWEFHKVHHSATVMNPITNYREHPLDNLVYAMATGVPAGLVAAFFARLCGTMPVAFDLLGVNVLVFIFNYSGYNLRHSHVWLRWPGPLAYLFGSPAHHQIHHSQLPEHVDKNFAFTFPIWDVLFGTYCLPNESPDLKLGLGDGTEGEYRSFLTLYFLPVKKLFARFLHR